MPPQAELKNKIVMLRGSGVLLQVLTLLLTAHLEADKGGQCAGRREWSQLCCNGALPVCSCVGVTTASKLQAHETIYSIVPADTRAGRTASSAADQSGEFHAARLAGTTLLGQLLVKQQC